MTLEETGRKYQISKQRVREIAENYITHCHQYLKIGYSMKKTFRDTRELMEKWKDYDITLKKDALLFIKNNERIK